MSHNLVIVVGGDEDDLLELVRADDDEGEEFDEDDPGSRPRIDYYRLGGSWRGYWPLVPGRTGQLGEPRDDDEPTPEGVADRALLHDIDVEGLRGRAASLASSTWDRWHAAVARLPPERSFVEILEDVETAEVPRGRWWRRETPRTRDDLRTEALRRHAAQPRVAALRAAFDGPIDVVGADGGLTPDEVPRDAYIEIEVLGVFCGTAIFHNPVWRARPFALSDGWEAELEWLRRWGRWPDEVSPDTLVSAVDVHF